MFKSSLTGLITQGNNPLLDEPLYKKMGHKLRVHLLLQEAYSSRKGGYKTTNRVIYRQPALAPESQHTVVTLKVYRWQIEANVSKITRQLSQLLSHHLKNKPGHTCIMVYGTQVTVIIISSCLL